MGFRNYEYRTGDWRKNIIAIVWFVAEMIWVKRAAIAAIIVGWLTAGEVTGVNSSIRARISSELMTPPDQGGALHSVDSYVRDNFHPDWKNVGQ